jgi:hypothetical protein
MFMSRRRDKMNEKFEKVLDSFKEKPKRIIIKS